MRMLPTQRAPTGLLAIVAAIVSGLLLGQGKLVGGIILAVIAVVLMVSWQFWDKGNSGGLY